MGDSSGDRRVARVVGKPWNAVDSRWGNSPWGREAVTVVGRKLCPGARVQTMGRWKSRRGGSVVKT